MDVFEEEGLGAGVWSVCESVFRGPEEKVVTDCGEIEDVAVESSQDWVFEIEGIEHSPDEGDVGRVGSCSRVVFIRECGEEVFKH
jgi:hypothetical protein